MKEAMMVVQSVEKKVGTMVEKMAELMVGLTVCEMAEKRVV